MFNRISFLTLCMMIASVTYSIAQHHGNVINRNLSKVNQEMMIVASGNSTFTLDEIEGSPYLTEDCTKSKMVMENDEILQGALLRYNIYNDKFEFKKGNQHYELVNVEDIRHILHLNKDFIHRTYRNGSGKLKKGYMVRLIKGPCAIYKRYKTVFHEPEPARSSFHDPKPPRFDQEDPLYFIQLQDQEVPEEITSFRRGKFLNRFGSQEGELKEYIRDQDIDLDEEEELIGFARYYNNKFGKEGDQ